MRAVIEFVKAVSPLYFYSSLAYLKRVNEQYECDVIHKHTKKLTALYGGNIFFPKFTNNIINISDYCLSGDEKSFLNKGLNFSLKSHPKTINRQIEMEKLYMSILDKKDQNKVTIESNEHLKTKLKCFGIKHQPNTSLDPLTKEEKQAAKNLKNNANIIIQRPDKGGGVVIMNRADYVAKLHTLISDQNKFRPCDKKQSEIVKSKLNSIINTFKHNNWHTFYKLRRSGEFYNGHLYGLPKVHKDEKNPPLRPIISMSGTVTHEVAQFLNDLIRPYLNTSKIVRSSTEVLADLRELTLSPDDHVVSLDVESLFTNVPVNTTIDYIIDSVYHHTDRPAPDIPLDTVKSLLQICTTETPFEFEGETYVQVDGVSMGSPLGPTFADFYMSHLENKLLHEKKVSNPWYYKRYVDDIIAIFHSKSHVNWFKIRLSRNSILNFTHEEMTHDTFHFLDIQLQLMNTGKFNTSVYIKPTDKGIYANFNSHIPETYKKSVVKTLIYRAYRYCNTWNSFVTEVDRIKQTLANNSYPQWYIDRVIRNCTDKFSSSSISQQPQDDKNIILYVKLEDLSCFKKDERLLKNIVSEHVIPTDKQYNIKLLSYYKPFKISSLFSTRPKRTGLQKSNVVYRFNCQEDGCNASYIGYTTNTLLKRCNQHRYNPSSIYRHYNSDHNRPVPISSLFSTQFSVIHSYNNINELRIAEALCIRENRPYINVKYNEMSCCVNLYR